MTNRSLAMRSLWLWLRVMLVLITVVSGCGSEGEETDSSDEPASFRETREQPATAVKPADQERRVQIRRAGYGKRKGARRKEGFQSVTVSEIEKKVVEIQTVQVAYRTLRSIHTAMGKVLAPRSRMAIVTYAFPARIAEIHVEIGDWVERGQKVLTIQSEEVGTAKSEFFKAEADLELARTNYERESRLFERGVGAQKNLLSAEAAMKVAQANLEAVEKKLHVLGFTEEEVRRLSETHQINPVVSLFAPIQGKIIEHRAVLGAMIDQSTELLTIMDPRILWIDAEIFERDISKIRAGQTVRITVPAFPGRRFTGRISYISDILNEETRTVTVRTEVENKDLKLKPGMFADIEILVNQGSRVLVVPVEAVLDDGGDKIVFTKVGDRYIRKIVEVGAKDDGFWEILDGLERTDEVVTVGNYQLKSKLYEEELGTESP